MAHLEAHLTIKSPRVVPRLASEQLAFPLEYRLIPPRELLAERQRNQVFLHQQFQQRTVMELEAVDWK